MTAVAVRSDRTVGSLLGRASPVTTLAVALAWLVALATTARALPTLSVLVVALAAGHFLGGLTVRALARALLPLWVAALTVAVFNALFAASNRDPAAATALLFGPVRITEPALAAGLGLGLRVAAIVATGVTWGRVTDPTHLADALVQQTRLPERFAYGALASLQAIPWIADDLTALREARRMRGLRASWHPRVLVALLVLAIRRAERLAVAMDARGFSAPGRTRYRVVGWRREDAVVAAGGVAILVLLIVFR